MAARDCCVLITGASAGLGLAITRALIPQGYRLILTARQASLPRFAAAGIVANERIWIRPLDVTSHGERVAVIREAEQHWGGVDVLVNNAGIAYRSVVEHVTDADRMAQMDVNYRAPMDLARLVLPSMRHKCWGRILNVSSVGGMMAMPTMSVYSASKFALEGASEALYYEVRPWNIWVSLIEPGFINSDGFEHTLFTELSRRSSLRPGSPYYEHYRNMDGFIAQVMCRVAATPESVARKVVRTIEQSRPPLRVPATFDAVLFAWLRRLLPRRLYHYVLYRSLPNVRRWGPASSGLPGRE